MQLLFLSLILVSSLAGAQSFPDAPQPQPAKQSIWKPWDYNRPQRSYGETFKSPLFYGPFFGLLAANAIDIEATRQSGCGEAHEFGKKPSRLEQYGQDYAADFAVGSLAFFLHRAHIKVIPQAMLGYGIGIHVHGAIKGFQANCR